MKLKRSHLQKPARFELLPLIDIIFLLLIFFIFVMLKMTIQDNIRIELPQLVETTQQLKKPLTVTIDADNQIFINEQACTLQQAVSKVQALQQKESKQSILIRGDQQADLGVALTLLDKLRQNGLKQVAFATEKAKKVAK